jgi:hypothetical protein
MYMSGVSSFSSVGNIYVTGGAASQVLASQGPNQPLTWTATSAFGDNLGNHIATATLQMGAYGVNTSSNITAARYQINGSTMVAILPGTDSIAYGVYAGTSNITGGDYNVFIGNYAGTSNTTGVKNTANGAYALYNNTGGYSNTANGAYALYSNTGGIYNTANGAYALYNTTGWNNTANGAYSLSANTDGGSNAANGTYALRSNTTGSDNTANGYNALYENLTGWDNTANGSNSLYNNTTGRNNAANGASAIKLNTTGWNNTANGAYALYGNTTGWNNTVSGYLGAYYNQTGSQNAVFGYSAGGYGAGGPNSFSSATIMGAGAGFNITTGSNNTLYGWQAGYNIKTGTGNIIIGYDQRAPADNTNNFLNIGGLLFGDLSAKTIGISTRTPAAALDIVSTGTAANIYAQIWRNGSGVEVASMTSTGVLYPAVPATDNTKVAKAGDTMTGQLTNQSTVTVLGSAFSVGGSTFVVANGNVGIGIAVPTNRLSVTGPSIASAGTASQTGTALSGSGTSWTPAMMGKTFIFANGASAVITGYTSGTSLTASVSQSVASQNYNIHDSGMQVNSSGYIGVGAGIPAAPFTVTNNSGGTAIAMNHGYYTNTIGQTNAKMIFDTSNSGTSGFGFRQGGTEEVTIDSIGNVGIRTASPLAPLDIVSTGTAANIYAQIWRNGSGVVVASMTSQGVLYATVAVAGDNLGNHIATQNLNMSAKDIVSVSTISVSSITTTASALTVSTNIFVNGSVVAAGTFGADWTEPGLGAGTRLLWYPRKAAFRAGSVSGTQWNDANINTYSIGLGSDVTASGAWSVAIGRGVTASGHNSMALGTNTSSLMDYALATNYGTSAKGYESVAMGNTTTADSRGQMSVGAYNLPTGGENTSTWVWTDPLFVIGNGTGSGASRANALMVLKNGNVGISTSAPSYHLHVSSGAGETGTIMAVSTGTTNLFWVAGDGAHAMKFWGDGSGLTNLVGAGDNLGNHVATTTLNMAGHSVLNVDSMSIVGLAGTSGAILTISTGTSTMMQFKGNGEIVAKKITVGEGDTSLISTVSGDINIQPGGDNVNVSKNLNVAGGQSVGFEGAAGDSYMLYNSGYLSVYVDGVEVARFKP